MEVFLMLTQQYGILVALLVLFGWGMIVFTYKYARLISTCEALKEVIANVKKDVFEHIKDGGRLSEGDGGSHCRDPREHRRNPGDNPTERR